MNPVKTFLLGAILAVISVPASAATPDEFITDAIDELSQNLDQHRSQYAEDSDALFAMIDELLLPRFDRRMSAQQVLAKHWRDASEEQQTRFIDAFYLTLVQRYANGILDFEHDRIEVLPFRGDDTKRTALVKTRVDLEDGTNISVNYRLISHDTGWMMFDVEIEGVSYVRNFRAEFDAEIAGSSLEEVINRLENEATGGADE